MEEDKPKWRLEAEATIEPILRRLKTLDKIKSLKMMPEMEKSYKLALFLRKEIEKKFKELDSLPQHGPDSPPCEKFQGERVYERLQFKIERACDKMEMMCPVMVLDHLVHLNRPVDESQSKWTAERQN